MRTHPFLIVAALLAIHAPRAEGQSHDPAPARRLSPRPDHPLHLTYRHDTAAGLERPSGAVASSQRADLYVGLPLYVSSELIVAAAAGYGYRSLSLSDHQQYDSERLGLHRLRLASVVSVLLDPSWSLTLSAGGELAGDFNSPSGDGFTPTVRGLATWAFAEDSALLFGAAFSRSVFGLVPIPVLGYAYKPRGLGFHAMFLLPARAQLGYRVTRTFDIQLGMVYEATVWEIDSSPLPDHVVQSKGFSSYAGVEMGITPQVDLQVRAGLSLAQQYQLLGPDGRERDVDQDPAPFVQLGVGMRP